MQSIMLKDVPRGELVKRKPDAKGVFIRDDYCRGEKRYALQSWDDINKFVYLKGATIVYIDFEF